jgi:excinuclease UvrABC ATPase subunit
MKASRPVAAVTCLLITAALPAAAQPGTPRSPTVSSQQGQMSDAMVSKVGTALRHVATIRQQYSQRAQGADSQQQQALSDQAKNEMVKAIGDQGLSVQQYQQAIQMAQNDETLKRRLLSVAEAGDK